VNDIPVKAARAGGRGARPAMRAAPDFEMLSSLKRGLPECEPMTPNQVERIDAASMAILEEVGVMDLHRFCSGLLRAILAIKECEVQLLHPPDQTSLIVSNGGQGGRDRGVKSSQVKSSQVKSSQVKSSQVRPGRPLPDIHFAISALAS
jgi:Trimethylamine methyltransferase (MTTB)